MVRDLRIAKIFSLATFSAAIVLSPPVSAQHQSDSFSTCFSILSGSFRNDYALSQCRDMFAGQSPNESFSTCFGTLSGSFRNDYALSQCQAMFVGQSLNESFSACFNTLSASFRNDYANEKCQELVRNSRNSDNNDNNNNRVFRMVNNTGATVEALYLAPSNGSVWGPNDLNGTLPSGRSVDLRLESPSCAYDFYANLSDGRQITERQINTCDYTGYRLR